MKLKALEICGFKSFAEKTRLTFDKPVTCIVGPNGSGKSNISDAVLWVTGEQSTKALRGGKMEDVIFGGTVLRRQMGYAEVTLILDNEDGSLPFAHSEVSITRRYYRSGESEYYINRELCRLKDINELLMDTGMGQEGYSIIGQGRIDEILSVRSTDRRAIFEEAAGISRFRHRKEESERKLSRTEDNLQHINAKISELELMVEPLREQSETARKYLLLRDWLRELEIALWAGNLNTLSEQRNSLEQEKKEKAFVLQNAKDELASLYEETENFSAAMRELDMEGENLRSRSGELEEQISEVESSAAVLSANLESNASEQERISRELSSQESQDENLVSQIAGHRESMEQLSVDSAGLEKSAAELDAVTAELLQSENEKEEQVSALLAEERELSGDLNREKASVFALSAAAQELEDRADRIARDHLTAAERVSALQTEKSEKTDELEKKRDELVCADNIISGYKLREESRRKKSEQATEKCNALETEYKQLTGRISLLKELEKDYSGYSRAVKTVMQEAERGVLKGVFGTVGSLLKTDDEYALAVETALGAGMQDILVANEESGKNCIQFLKRRDAGRATFLPIKTVKGTELKIPSLPGEAGYVGTGLELVRFDETYRGVYTYLLGRVVVVETLDDAIRISRKNKEKFKLVTLDGQVINANGSMTGGSTAKNAGILSRANELNALNAKSIELEKERKAAVEKEKAARSEWEDAKHQLTVSVENRQLLVEQQLRLQGEYDRCVALLNEAESAMNSLKEEKEDLRARIESNAVEILREQDKCASLESRLAANKQAFDSLASGRDDVRAKLAQYRAEQQTLREKQAAVQAEYASHEKAIEELEQVRSGLAEGLYRQSGLIEELRERARSIREQQEGSVNKASELREKKQGLKLQIDAVTAKKLLLEKDRTEHSKKIQERNNELLRLDREVSLLEQKESALVLEEKQLVDKLWESYELSRSDAIKQAVELSSVSEAKKQAAGLKKSIAALGTPNIGAIEEFERINARYTFFVDQRADIEKALTELRNIIGDITEEMKQIFSREFQAINNQFKETFLELFGGGKAELELEDESDILNCGIEIKVQPPGKSLKTITLLSGGEKAFVAIALYFAVLKVRPAPFVIMDEIEAALDETNVSRFAEYMRRMAENTQMIIISHRRGTMEEADVLYGVTMQEQGVSRVLSVDLDEAEQAITE